MSARDDYPLTARLADATPGNRQREAARILDEIDRLRAALVTFPAPPANLPAAAIADYEEYFRQGGRFDLTTWWDRYKDDYQA